MISLGGELGRNSPRVVHSFTARLRNVYGSRGDRLQRIAIDQGQPSPEVEERRALPVDQKRKLNAT